MPVFAHSENALAFSNFHDKIGLQIFMEVLLWLIRSVPLASAAALAQTHVPWVRFPRVMIVT